jgi:hypothetical protein
MSGLVRVLVLSLVCAALAACAYNGAPLVATPNGTVDSTHGPNGAQTSPR